MTATAATPETFKAQVSALTAQLAGSTRDAALDTWLNREHGPASQTFAALKAACQAGLAPGWLVCPPGSAHRSTAAHGRALVLYRLPDGQIQLTR